jgi:predicted nucleotidyltransferase
MTKLPSPYKYKKSIWALSLSCFLLLICYFSLVGKTVANVLERQNSEREISDITASVSKIEFSYLSEKSSVNASLARELGFVEVEKTSIAKQTLSLSLNEI